MNNILRNGDAEQRRRYLPGLCRRPLVGALALTEPGAGSDAVGGMATTARRDGDHYLLRGRKLFITNGPIADVILVYAKTAPDKGARGISAFIVEKGFPGFSVAQKLIKMGCRGSPTGELVFEDCRVPVANRIGAENAGVAILMSGLDLERAVARRISVGAAERAARAVARLRARAQAVRQADRRVPDDPGEARRHVRWAGDDAVPHIQGARGGERARGRRRRPRRGAQALRRGAAARGRGVNSKIAADAVQIHGGAGYMWEMEVNRIYRATKLIEIGAGTSEVRRMIIAEELLRA